MQARIEVCFLTGKLVALIAKIDLFFLVTLAYSTIPEQLALFIATSPAVFRGKIVQHLLEIRILAKNWVFQKRLESFSIVVEISQFLFESEAQGTYVAVHMRKTRFATKAARSYRLLDFFIGHAVSPSTEIPTSVGNAL